MRLVVACVISLLLIPSVNANTNRVVTGGCANGRTWWCNTEFNNNGVPICQMGQGCDGVAYNTCQGSGGTPNGSIDVGLSGGVLTVTPTVNGRITIHDASTGTVVYEVSGIVSANSSVSISVSAVGSGNFIIAGREDGTDRVFESELWSW